MKFRTSRKVMLGLGVCGGVVMLLGIDHRPVLIAGMVIALAGLGVVLRFCRCPECGHRLSPQETEIRYCPYCGKKLD